MSKKKIPNTVGVFSLAVGSVAYEVCYDPDELQAAIDSICDVRGCHDCKYLSLKDSKCCRPSLVINFTILKNEDS